MNRVAKQQGFTLVELMLAMAFISVLLLAIAMTIIQLGTIYNRGVTLKEMNQVARSVSDDLRRTVAGAEPFTVADSYIKTTAGGRLCLGNSTYIWNTQKAITNRDRTLVNNPQTNTPIQLAKVTDLGGSYCVINSDTGEPVTGSIRAQDVSKTTELLQVGDHTLSIHSFEVKTDGLAKDETTNQQLYEISFTIGTSDLSALNDTQTGCKGPNEVGSDLAYCSVQTFTIVVRAGNRVN